METLKTKFGPFPVWVWLALVTGLLLAWYLYEQHKNGSSSSTGSTSASDQAPEIVVQTGGDTSPTQTTTPPPEPPISTGPIPPEPGPFPGGGSGPPPQNPNHLTPAEGKQISKALPGTKAAGAANLAATGVGNEYNTPASKSRAQSRKNARIAARHGKAAPKAPPGKPAPKKTTAKKDAAPARHLATSHPVKD